LVVTIRAVAERAGVSVGTVSNVLNRPSYVTPETRTRVLEAIEELGFVPTNYRRQFRPGRERVIGCVMVDLANPFFVDVALGVEEAATKRGAGVVICHSNEEVVREEQNLDLLIQLRVHGIIVAPVEDENPRLDELRHKGVPLVYLDRLDPHHEISSVLVNHLEGGRLAARHLVGLGHRRLAFVAGPERSHLVRDRLAGFREVAAEAGIPDDAITVFSADRWTSEAGARSAAEFLALPPPERPTAVFCANDMLARGLMRACEAAGVSVPRDVSIVGYDDLQWAADLPVPLTTVGQPRAELGRVAARLLMNAIDDPQATIERALLQPNLVVRQSTTSPPHTR
jgi:LacI family transcriptional regulator